ncbi:O-methyltransferase [Chlamydoabsidia padenii]|nr:O-methyltransferase [Chlamydoabsidia padenii]
MIPTPSAATQVFPPPCDATQETWTAVDKYFEGLFTKDDPESANQVSEAAGLPPHNVSPTQGKFLNLICKLMKARRVLEIGTLGAYSTIWLARALPDDGVVVTLESNENHARVARQNIDHANLAHRVELKVGPALRTLPTLVSEDPFDLVFIDADKVNNKHYYEWALKLTRPGSVIIMDNVVRNGDVIRADLEEQNESIRGTREFNKAVSIDSRVSATALQTIGVKGYDGFAFLLVN